MWTREQIPILRILFLLIIGISTVKYFPFLSAYSLPFGIIGLFLIFYGYLRQKGIQYSVWVAFIFLGICVMGNADDSLSQGEISPEKKIRLAIIKDKIATEEKGLQLDLLLLPSGMKIKTFTDIKENSNVYNIGDTLVFKSQLSVPTDAIAPWQFNFKQYLNRQNIYFTTFFREKNILQHRVHSGFNLSAKAYKIKHKAIVLLGAALPDKVSINLIKSITFGDKTSLDKELRTQMQEAGLMHIMAVSGLHIGIIYLFFTYLFLFLKRFSILRRLFTILGIWAFILLCGMPASAVRAGIMLSIYEMGKQFSRRPHKFNVLGISAFLILIFDPFQLFQIGFQFSFMAISGIFFFYEKIKNLFLHYSALPASLCSSLGMSLAAQGILSPLCLYYFGYLSYWFWLWTIIAIPLTTAIMLGSMLTVGIKLLSLSSVAEIVAYVPYLAGYGLEHIGYFQSKLPVNGLILHVPWYFMLALMLIIVAYIMHSSFGIRLRKFIFFSSFLWLLSFSLYRVELKQYRGVFVFSSFDESHILVKNGHTGIVIGDPLRKDEQLSLEAYYGIEHWQHIYVPLFTQDLELVIGDEIELKHIATLLSKSSNDEIERKSPKIYKAAPWEKQFNTENHTNISQQLFSYKD